jgi:hypothetical protein
MADHSMAEKIAKEVGNTMFVVWWTYHANFAEPKIVIANNPAEAFQRGFPLYAESHHDDFKKYVVEIQNGSKYTVLP